MYHQTVMSRQKTHIDECIEHLHHELAVYGICRKQYDLEQVKQACIDLISAIESTERSV